MDGLTRLALIVPFFFLNVYNYLSLGAGLDYNCVCKRTEMCTSEPAEGTYTIFTLHGHRGVAHLKGSYEPCEDDNNVLLKPTRQYE